MERRPGRRQPKHGAEQSVRRPNPAIVAEFRELCVQEDIHTEEGWARFASYGNALQQAGWSPEQVIETLWEARPDCKPEGRTAAEAVEMMRAEEQAVAREHARMAREQRDYPWGSTMDEVNLHKSIIHEAAVTGRQIVFRGVASEQALPPDIPAFSEIPPRERAVIHPPLPPKNSG